MKGKILFIRIIVLFSGCSKNKKEAELKPLHVEQLKNTNTEQDWFVPTKIAIAGLSSVQSNWKDHMNTTQLRNWSHI